MTPKDRRGGFDPKSDKSDRKLQLFGPKPSCDWQTAELYLRAHPGKTIVEMAPVPKEHGGIFIANGQGHELTLRPDAGVVLAAGLGVPLTPGQVVLVNHTHGKWIDGFVAGPYQAENEVRVYGRAAVVKTGKCIDVPWHQSILAVAEGWPEGGWNMPTIIPTHGKVLIRREGLVKRTANGLYIPDRVHHRSSKGRVVAVAPSAHARLTDQGMHGELELKVGALVCYQAQTRRIIKAPDIESDLCLVDVDDILFEILDDETYEQVEDSVA